MPVSSPESGISAPLVIYSGCLGHGHPGQIGGICFPHCHLKWRGYGVESNLDKHWKNSVSLERLVYLQQLEGRFIWISDHFSNQLTDVISARNQWDSSLPVWFLLTIWTPFVFFFCTMQAGVRQGKRLHRSTVIRFMMGEDSMRFAQLIRELGPRIGAFQITQFMCSAWMKPVCTHTMGHQNKTVNTSPILADPSVWRSFSFKQHIFYWSPVCFVRASHYWMVESNTDFIVEKQLLLCRPDIDTLYIRTV